jgi:hypothetical protein
VPRWVARSFFCISPEDPASPPGAVHAQLACARDRDINPIPQTGRDPEQSGRLSPVTLGNDGGGGSGGGSGDNDDDEADENQLLAAIEDEVLDLFADEYCNKHLLFSIVETVLVRLLPELSEHSVTELMEERGILST